MITATAMILLINFIMKLLEIEIRNINADKDILSVGVPFVSFNSVDGLFALPLFLLRYLPFKIVKIIKIYHIVTPIKIIVGY